MAARVDNGRVQLLTRTWLDWTGKYSGVAAALANISMAADRAERVVAATMLVRALSPTCGPKTIQSAHYGGDIIGHILAEEAFANQRTPSVWRSSIVMHLNPPPPVMPFAV
jgi:hypothetical protein